MKFNAETVYSLYLKVQETTPLIHNITNYVVMQQTANALLAVGASPVMAHAIEEVDEMATLADALVINIGTLSTDWIASMHSAMRTANYRKIPVVFDPVGSGATRFRTEISKQVINDFSPTVIRANASEIGSLFSDGHQTRGVDNTSDSTQMLKLAQDAAKKFGFIISMSGATDYITDGESTLSISNGDKIMTQVTGMGCTASALTAALLTTNENQLICAATAMALNGIAGQIAAEKAIGTGSFQIHFLDSLSRLNHEIISQHLQFEQEF
jgi:hydroxyethylthiazole kinase